MKNLKALVLVALIGLGFGGNAQASSHYQICSNADGSVVVENGNVTIKGGVGDVGPARTQKVIKELSRKDESCVDGPNYSTTIETVERVTYKVEEQGPASSEYVICTESLTGIMPPGSKCK